MKTKKHSQCVCEALVFAEHLLYRKPNLFRAFNNEISPFYWFLEAGVDLRSVHKEQRERVLLFVGLEM